MYKLKNRIHLLVLSPALIISIIFNANPQQPKKVTPVPPLPVIVKEFYVCGNNGRYLRPEVWSLIDEKKDITMMDAYNDSIVIRFTDEFLKILDHEKKFYSPHKIRVD